MTDLPDQQQQINKDDDMESYSSNDVSIDLSQRYLQALPISYFTHYHQHRIIKDINLSHNQFVTLPLMIFRFTNLRSLDVSNNQLAMLPKEFCALRNLTHLYLRNNLLESLPIEFEQLNLLEEINLSGNLFELFPVELLPIKSLRILYLGANRIQFIPSTISSLTNLQILYIGGNALTDVPQSIGRLYELTALGLADNHLESIPDSIANLYKLQNLSLHNNRLKVLPPGIAKLKNLECLSLRNNPLVTDFVNEVLLEPPTLKELAARIVKIRFPYELYKRILPCDLSNYLSTANQCVNPNCKGVYFESGAELVKFVDFCGKYRVPLLHYLCSPKCSTNAPVYAYSSSSESDDDRPTTSSNLTANVKMRKVLLG